MNVNSFKALKYTNNFKSKSVFISLSELPHIFIKITNEENFARFFINIYNSKLDTSNNCFNE